MKLHELTSSSRKSSKRVGRGRATGHGRTAGRGDKGQGQRKSGGVRPGFEGGQTPLWRKMPKLRGFTSRRVKPVAITVATIDKAYADGETVSTATLVEKGLLKNESQGVKIIGGGQCEKKLKVEIDTITESAKKNLC